MSVLKRISLVLARFQRLLKAKVEVNAKDETGRTPERREAANVNAEDRTGRTALHWAAFKGHIVAIQILLEARVNVNAKDKTGKTALHWVASEGQVAATRVLLESGADVNVLGGGNGGTALHGEALRGHVMATQTLLKAGANINALDKTGRTALEVARVGMDRTKSDRTKSVRPFLEVIDLLKAHGGL